jgi:hypothetical protein
MSIKVEPTDSPSSKTAAALSSQLHQVRSSSSKQGSRSSTRTPSAFNAATAWEDMKVGQQERNPPCMGEKEQHQQDGQEKEWQEEQEKEQQEGQDQQQEEEQEEEQKMEQQQLQEGHEEEEQKKELQEEDLQQPADNHKALKRLRK